MGLVLPAAIGCSKFRPNSLRRHDVDAIYAGQVHSADSLQLSLQIESRRVPVRAGFLPLLLPSHRFSERGFGLNLGSPPVTLRESCQQRLESLVTLGNLILDEVIGVNRLLEFKEVVSPP